MVEATSCSRVTSPQLELCSIFKVDEVIKLPKYQSVLTQSQVSARMLEGEEKVGRLTVSPSVHPNQLCTTKTKLKLCIYLEGYSKEKSSQPDRFGEFLQEWKYNTQSYSRCRTLIKS